MAEWTTLFLVAEYVLGFLFIEKSVSIDVVRDASNKRRLGGSIELFGFILGVFLLALAIMQKVL